MHPLVMAAVAGGGGPVLEGVLTAAASSLDRGYKRLLYGTLVPEELNGLQVQGIWTTTISGARKMTLILGTPNTDATFFSVSFTGTFAGGSNPRTETWLRSDATFNASDLGQTSWTFSNDVNGVMVDTNEYDVLWATTA